MTNRWLILIPILCGLSPVASAQTNVVFNRVPVNIDVARINIEDLVEDAALEDDDKATVVLRWTVVSGLGPGSWDYELTYGAITETSTAPERLRVVDLDGLAEAQGDQFLGVETRVEVFLADILENPEDLPTVLGGQGRDDFDQSICVNVYPAGNPDFNQTSSECWTFEVDTEAPPPPTITELVPGENRVQVSWEGINDNNLESYQIVYCTNASTTTLSFEELPCPESEQKVRARISETLETISISEDIRNGERVVVAMRSVDEFDNVGVVGDVDDTFPTSVDDFFELYEGNEDGGFCFMATAAYGSYSHPMVQVLRAFRDRVLMATPAGQAFVWAYYRYAPPLALEVAADPALAGWVRVWLIPLAGLALLIMLGPVLALAWLLHGAVRRRGESSARVGAQAARIGLGLIVLAAPMVAQASRPDSDFDTVGVGFEFKGGPYSGEIQNEPGFSDVFDDESRPLFTLGMDLQVLRMFGTVTVGGTIGFLQYTGRGLFGKGSPDAGSPSRDTNVFNLMPLTATIGYRFDVLADQTWIPLVPYVRGGLAYYIWWATNGIGNLQRRTPEEEEDRQSARGGKFGYTGTLGVAFMLNKLEPRVAQSLFANTSIRGTYVFVELNAAQVDGFGGDGFDLSDFNWNVGLYLEL